MFSNPYTLAIYLLVLVFIFLIIKVIIRTVYLKRIVNKSYMALQKNIDREQYRLQRNSGKIQLLEDLHKTLFNRLFKITRDIILLQKLIFETQIK